MSLIWRLTYIVIQVLYVAPQVTTELTGSFVHNVQSVLKLEANEEAGNSVPHSFTNNDGQLVALEPTIPGLALSSLNEPSLANATMVDVISGQEKLMQEVDNMDEVAVNAEIVGDL